MRLLSILLMCWCVNVWGGTYTTDGTDANVQSNYNAATTAGAGNTLVIPTGNFTWSSSLQFTNPNWFILQGQGSGRVIGDSLTMMTVQTGPVTMTTQSGLPITLGQTLTVERKGGSVSLDVFSKPVPSMVGTVTAYSGTSLTLNVTTTNGPPAAPGITGHPEWIISTQPSTVITNNISGANNDLIVLDAATNGHTRIYGIRFTSGVPGNVGVDINVHRINNGQACLIDDNYFYLDQSISGININDNQGVIWSNSFVAMPFSQARLAIHFQNGPHDSWNKVSNFGTNDLGGTNNLYVEDCDMHAFLNWGDWDDNGRVVTRNCWFDEAGTGTHGADTSNYGVRYYEFYWNRGEFHGYNNGQTLNLNWWFFLRGGTGIFASNQLDNITSTDFESEQTWSMTVFNLQQPGGPHGCWGQGTTNGADYPAPRQVGSGNPNGSTTPADAFAFTGTNEPMYCWANAGGGGGKFGWREGNGGCTPPVDNSRDYIVQNRDFFTNTPAPGWSPYTYPHPLRLAAVSDPAITVQPANQTVSSGQTASFSVTATTGDPPLTYQWSKNSSTIAGATLSSYSYSAPIGDNGALFSVQVCNATNACIGSADALLTVTNAATNVVTITGNITITGNVIIK